MTEHNTTEDMGEAIGIALAYSKPPYDKWERLEPIAIEGAREKWGTVDIEIDGMQEHNCYFLRLLNCVGLTFSYSLNR